MADNTVPACAALLRCMGGCGGAGGVRICSPFHENAPIAFFCRNEVDILGSSVECVGGRFAENQP